MAGLATNELITGKPVAGGGIAPVTTTCVVAVVVPAAPEAVKVYTVVVVGETALDPVKATLPMPWSIVTVVALVTVQLRVDVCPPEMLAGLALNDWTTGCRPGSVIVPPVQPASKTAMVISAGTSFFIVCLPSLFCSRTRLTRFSYHFRGRSITK